MITIFYDENCLVCTKIKKVMTMMDFDNQFEFKSLHDNSIYTKYPTLNYWDCRKTIHLIDERGVIFTSENAVVEIIRRLRLLNKSVTIFESTLGKLMLRSLYGLLNNYRHKLQSDCASCV